MVRATAQRRHGQDKVRRLLNGVVGLGGGACCHYSADEHYLMSNQTGARVKNEH